MVIVITKTVIMVVQMMMMTILEGQHCLWRYKVVLASFKPGIATINVAVRTIIVTKLITTTVTTIIISITFITIIITRPKPAFGRQGLAGSWGQDTDKVSNF